MQWARQTSSNRISFQLHFPILSILQYKNSDSKMQHTQNSQHCIEWRFMRCDRCCWVSFHWMPVEMSSIHSMDWIILFEKKKIYRLTAIKRVHMKLSKWEPPHCAIPHTHLYLHFHWIKMVVPEFSEFSSILWCWFFSRNPLLGHTRIAIFKKKIEKKNCLSKNR